MAAITGLTAATVAIHGYHLGIEDQAIYLPAIKQALDPSLYPHDSVFFEPQTRATVSSWIVAASIRLTGLSVPVAIFVWHVFSVWLFLAGCWACAGRALGTFRAQFGSVALITALLTLPLAGTSLYLVDQHLHPRAQATALILFAVYVVLDRPKASRQAWGNKQMLFALALILGAAAIHIMMAFYGAIFVVLLSLPARRARLTWVRSGGAYGVLALPFAQFFQPASAQWLEATRSRSQHYLLRWEWYEWLGIFGPLAILWMSASWAERRDREVLARLCRSAVWLGLIGFATALCLIPARMERLTPYQPMRTFHLAYLVLLLVSGGVLAEAWMKARLWRWAVVLLPLAGAMFYAQRDLFEFSRHIEWPNRSTGNAWVEAFDWVRANTPKNAYFALDPHYISTTGEDYHGFRALAERSQMADFDKDPGVVSLFPALAPRWSKEVHALERWKALEIGDFERLNRDFGVNWVVLDARAERSQNLVAKLDCPYRNIAVYVCRLSASSRR